MRLRGSRTVEKQDRQHLMCYVNFYGCLLSLFRSLTKSAVNVYTNPYILPLSKWNPVEELVVIATPGQER